MDEDMIEIKEEAEDQISTIRKIVLQLLVIRKSRYEFVLRADIIKCIKVLAK